MLLDKDLVGQQENIELFNKIGNLDNLEGRLTVWLTINQTPRVHWEFETARGEYNFNSLFESPQKLTSWDSSDPQFVVVKPISTFQDGQRRQSRGYAEQSLLGDINADAHYFDFYLPNTDFIRKAMCCNDDDDVDEIKSRIETIKKSLNCDSFKADIGNNWSVELSTTAEALAWLIPKSQNRGSMITSKISFSQTDQESTNVEDLMSLSLSDSHKIISDLCLMLSYANGGYIKPIYAIAKKFAKAETDQIVIEEVAAIAGASTDEGSWIVPQEELGIGFIRHVGIKDMLDFVRCFPTFQKMLQTFHWKEKWIVFLEWYFQVIPRATGRRRNVLSPVVANALGTLLENLAWIILVEEEPNSKRSENNEKLYTKQKLKALISQIGISGEDAFVDCFVDIRNNSTHAKTKVIKLSGKEISEIKQLEVIFRAIQWVDEIILWRLGYEGRYIERNLNLNQGIQYSNRGIQPRYDLSKRDPSW